MNTASRILGNHAFFFRDGDAFTVPSAGTASRTSKPGATDPKWIDMGIISETGLEPGSEEREIWGPSPGQLRLQDVIETKRDRKFDLQCEELSPLAIEALFGTLPLDSASTQYNPLEGKTLKGWLKLQQYDQSDALVNTVDAFVHLKVNGKVTFGDDVVRVPFLARVLHSTLNTGALA